MHAGPKAPPMLRLKPFALRLFERRRGSDMAAGTDHRIAARSRRALASYSSTGGLHRQVNRTARRKRQPRPPLWVSEHSDADALFATR